jgi:hypothetical protein
MSSLAEIIEEQLKQVAEDGEKTGNYEDCHEEADELLCRLLISLGYENVVREYKKVPKWFS